MYNYTRNVKQEYQTAQSENSNGTELYKRYEEIMDKSAAVASCIRTCICLHQPTYMYSICL